jgi:hypothetical protein
MMEALFLLPLEKVAGEARRMTERDAAPTLTLTLSPRERGLAFTGRIQMINCALKERRADGELRFKDNLPYPS